LDQAQQKERKIYGGEETDEEEKAAKKFKGVRREK
jgi:hypothetical protein